MSSKIPVLEARRHFADIINRARYKGERVVLTRHKQPVAAVVSLEDLELVEALEDRLDVAAARAALAAGGEPQALDDVIAELGLADEV